MYAYDDCRTTPKWAHQCRLQECHGRCSRWRRHTGGRLSWPRPHSCAPITCRPHPQWFRLSGSYGGIGGGGKGRIHPRHHGSYQRRHDGVQLSTNHGADLLPAPSTVRTWTTKKQASHRQPALPCFRRSRRACSGCRPHRGSRWTGPRPGRPAPSWGRRGRRHPRRWRRPGPAVERPGAEEGITRKHGSARRGKELGSKLALKKRGGGGHGGMMSIYHG